MQVEIYTTLKKGVLDPQGKAVETALSNLGFSGIQEIRQGKLFNIVMETEDPKKAKELALKICKALLANLVIEDYKINIIKNT